MKTYDLHANAYITKPVDLDQFIIYDHLSPTSPQLEGMYDFYVPDGSYDAFKWEKGKWVYIKDFDARTGKSKLDKLYNKPE